MPIFWLGLMGLLIFYGILGWVGGPGRVGIFYVDVVPSVTGMILVDSMPRPQLDRVQGRLQPHRPARLAAGLLQPGLYQPDDPVLHAGTTQRRIRHHRPRQGPVGMAGDLAPRLPQHPRAADHRHRAQLCQPAGRLGPDRDHLCLARHRQLHHHRPAGRRHERGAGRHGRRRLHLHPAQHLFRPALQVFDPRAK